MTGMEDTILILPPFYREIVQNEGFYAVKFFHLFITPGIKITPRFVNIEMHLFHNGKTRFTVLLQLNDAILKKVVC